MKINFKEDIILENNRVRLEPLDITHLEHLSQVVLDNPGILKYSPPKFGTIPLLQKYIENNVLLRADGKKYMWVIFDKEKQQYAGCSSFLNISQINDRLEIGSTWIGKSYQRTGLNRNCKLLLLSYAFENLACRRVELKTDGRNEQSKIAIEAIGAKYEGTLRSHTIMSDGYRRDTVYFSILSNEWKNIKLNIFGNIE